MSTVVFASAVCGAADETDRFTPEHWEARVQTLLKELRSRRPHAKYKYKPLPMEHKRKRKRSRSHLHHPLAPRGCSRHVMLTRASAQSVVRAVPEDFAPSARPPEPVPEPFPMNWDQDIIPVRMDEEWNDIDFALPPSSTHSNAAEENTTVTPFQEDVEMGEADSLIFGPSLLDDTLESADELDPSSASTSPANEAAAAVESGEDWAFFEDAPREPAPLDLRAAGDALCRHLQAEFEQAGYVAMSVPAPIRQWRAHTHVFDISTPPNIIGHTILTSTDVWLREHRYRRNQCKLSTAQIKSDGTTRWEIFVVLFMP